MRKRLLIGLVLLIGAWSGWSSAAEAPALELPDLEGHTHRLSEWNGKVVLVNFWATWCAPCQAEVRNLKRYQETFGARGLQIVGVGLDDAAKLRNFRDSVEMNYPVLQADPMASSDLLAAWGNRTGVVPYTVLLDINGRVLERVTGVVDDDVMEEVILPHLNGAAPAAPGAGLRTSLDPGRLSAASTDPSR